MVCQRKASRWISGALGVGLVALVPALCASPVTVSAEEGEAVLVRYSTQSKAGAGTSWIARSVDAALARTNWRLAQTESSMKDGGAPALAVRSLSSHALGVQRVALTRSLRAGEAQVLRDSLLDDPDVVDVVVDYRMPLAAVGPDPLLPMQWALGSSAAGIDAAAAWPLSQGEGIVVAVMDTGVRPHVDLQANLAAGGYDFVSSVEQARDGNGRDADPADPGDGYTGNCMPEVEEEPVPGAPPPPGNGVVSASWHGTKVAGVVAAVQGNAVGIAGVAPRATLLPVRIAGTCGALVSDMMDGIVWAAGGAGARRRQPGPGSAC